MVEFSDTRTGEIMTPRTEICAVPVGTSIRVARDLMTEEKYSRLPVYRDSIDNIEGVLYVRDLLQAWKEGKEDAPIDEIVRDAYFVPETKAASELLKSMQVNHVQIAIVIDDNARLAYSRVSCDPSSQHACGVGVVRAGLTCAASRLEFRSAIRGSAKDIMGAVGNGAGLPGISVPNGFSEQGLPTGVQFMGRAYAENTVLAVARTYQALTAWHTQHPAGLL